MILLVDDEPFYVGSYIDELRDAGYEVCVQSKVDLAVKLFEEKRSEIELVILDIMMPAGSVFKDIHSPAGLRTGFRMYDWLRQQATDLPIIVLTNVTSADIERKFADESNCRFFRKDQCLPFELLAVVNDFLTSPNQRV